MALNPVTVERLVQIAQMAAAAPKGGKAALYDSACRELCVSLPTLHRYLNKVTMKPERKQRSDAGAVSLSRTEAIAISALLMQSHRKNRKRLLSIGQAVQMLRANGEVRAERIDPDSGAILPLSVSAIARALRYYGMHPDQINRPSPAVELKSLHPNHVWQIDASLCVLYYLNASTKAESGLQVMQADQFYKNKPANLKRIEAERVWSYEATDHYSGCIAVWYVLGAESGANLSESFLQFIQQREGDPFHGVPFVLMMDRGSANTSGLFANLARRLQVKLIAHAPGNARATGQVEKARDLIERGFESGLSLRPVRDLDDLNAQAQRWVRWYNANQVHSRHGKTRYEQWLGIAPEQLRLAPPLQVCRELLSHQPEPRQVSDTLTVPFKGREFDVRSVPGVMVGEKLQVALNPYNLDSAVVVDTDADGNETLHTVPLVQRDEGGFRADANIIDEDYKRPPDTVLDANRKEVARYAMDADTDAEAEAKRKAKVLPFGGRIDPFKVIEQAPQRIFMPKRGTELLPTATRATAAARVLSPFEAASALSRCGVVMDAAKAAQVRAWYPEGVPEDELQALQERLTLRASLRMVAGGGAV